MHFCSYRSLCSQTPFFQVFRCILTSSTWRLQVFKEILAEDLPHLQFPLLCCSVFPAVLPWAKLENRIKKKGHFGGPAVSLQVLLAVEEDLWGLSGGERVRSEVESHSPSDRGAYNARAAPQGMSVCLSVCPSLWGWQEADGLPAAVPSVTLQMRLWKAALGLETALLLLTCSTHQLMPSKGVL